MKHALLPRLGISLYALTCFAASAAGEIAGTEHWVENAGTRIYVWEKVDMGLLRGGGPPEGSLRC